MMRDGYTDIGGTGNAFPSTCWTVIRGSTDPEGTEYKESADRLATLYWRPVYAYFRRKWGTSNEEAKDLTQEFFLKITSQDFLQKISPNEGRFRSYVRVSLDNFIRMRFRKKQAQKRGGQIAHVSIDPENVPRSPSPTPDEIFMKDWATATLDDALSTLEFELTNAGKEIHFELFRIREIDPPVDEDNSYETLADRFGITKNDVRNALYQTRKHFKKLVHERVRGTVSSDADATQEMAELFAHL
jgi:RNA polymerase sigma-70 factor (ECF subfamily)